MNTLYLSKKKTIFFWYLPDLNLFYLSPEIFWKEDSLLPVCVYLLFNARVYILKVYHVDTQKLYF